MDAHVSFPFSPYERLLKCSMRVSQYYFSAVRLKGGEYGNPHSKKRPPPKVTSMHPTNSEQNARVCRLFGYWLFLQTI